MSQTTETAKLVIEVEDSASTTVSTVITKNKAVEPPAPLSDEDGLDLTMVVPDVKKEDELEEFDPFNIDLSEFPEDQKASIETIQELLRSRQVGLDHFEALHEALDKPKHATHSDYVVTQEMDTFNRRLDRFFGTDVCLAFGDARKLINASQTGTYTRIFEAIGDYCPNLLAILNAKPYFLYPKKWMLVKVGAHCRVVTPGSPQNRNTCRYRLVNGKTVEIPQNEKLRPFIKLTQIDALDGARCCAFAENLTIEDIKSSCDINEQPESVSRLFAAAVTRGGGIKAAQLQTYFTPTFEELGGTQNAAEFLGERLDTSLTLKECVASSYKDALIKLTYDLQNDSLVDKELLQIWLDWVGPSMDFTEEEAKIIYENILSTLSGEQEPPQFGFQNTGKYAAPVPTRASEATIELSFDGVPQAPTVTWDTCYNLLAGYTFIPTNSSPNAQMLYGQIPFLLAQGAKAVCGHFSLSGPYYAKSISPRKMRDEMGKDHAGAFWKERMKFDLKYEGLIIVPAKGKSQELYEYCKSINTMLVREFVHRRTNPYTPLICRPLPGQGYQSAPPPPYADGVSFVEGQPVISNWLKDNHDWERHFVPDARLHLPIEILRPLLYRSDVFSIEDLESWLLGETPLVLIASINGESRRVPYHPNLVPNIRCTSILDAFNSQISQGEDQILDFTLPKLRVERREQSSPGRIEPTAIAVSYKEPSVASLQGTATLRPGETPPYDENNVIWQVHTSEATVPYNELDTWTESQSLIRPGDWEQLAKHFHAKQVSEETFRNLYTVHYSAAHESVHHPVVKYHNPAWTLSLKEEKRPMTWLWPTRKMKRQTVMACNAMTCWPLTGNEKLTHLKAAKHKMNSRLFFEKRLFAGGSSDIKYRTPPPQGKVVKSLTFPWEKTKE
jgi:hypothetical protein